MTFKNRIIILVLTFAIAVGITIWPDLFRSTLGLAAVILALAIYLFLTIPSYRERNKS